MSDLWTLEELLPFRRFSKEVIAAYLGCLAEHLGITERQARFLANEQAEIAAAVFCDTYYRLHKQGYLPGAGNGSKPAVTEFISRCQGLHPGFSRKFRAGLASLISTSYGGKPLNEDKISEPVEVRIEDVVKKEDIAERRTVILNGRIKKYSDWFGRQINKLLKNGIRPDRQMPRIAVMCPEYFDRALMALPGIKWVPIGWEESRADLIVEVNKRQELYGNLLDSYKLAGEKSELPLLTPDGPKGNLTDILLAVFVVLMPVNVLDKEKLHERLGVLRGKLEGINIQAVISKGTYGNGLLAAAAIGLGVPLISMQMGGGFGVLDLVEGLYEIQLHHFDHYFGDGWRREDSGLTAEGRTELHTFTDPGLSELAKLGKGRDRRANQNKLLFSPFVHSFLYRMELWHANYPENSLRIRQEMEKFFALFSRLDPEYGNYEIFVKLKAFSYKLFKGKEYLFGFMNYPSVTKLKYLTRGVAQEYFGDVQLHLTDSICTGLMCSLVYNFPTVAYWDKRTQTLTSQAEPVFKELEKQGVLACSAEAMAEAARKFMHYPEEWERRELQDARQAYVAGFARSGPDWEKDFSAVLKNILMKGAN
jgi:hypothetical protein